MDENRLKIIGIAGTNGSGKDTLGNILADYYNYLFISVTELLREECRRRGLEVDRHNLRMISAEWRREFGLGVLVEKAVKEFAEVNGRYRGLAIASLRNPGEADKVHELNGIVIWLDADPRLRYKRVQNGSHIRSHRAKEDAKTFKEFVAAEETEMHQSGDSATLDMSAVKEKADVHLDNSHETSEQFRVQVEKELDL